MAKRFEFDNPALAYISMEEPAPIKEPAAQEPTHAEQEPAAQPSIEKTPKGYRKVYIEKRTKRVQLVMEPSILSKIDRQCKKLGMSRNDYIITVLAAELEKGNNA